MRPTLHDKTLLLAKRYIAEGGRPQDIASAGKITYQRVWAWLYKQDTKASRLNADVTQRIYEHLTGKQLDY